MRLLKRWATIIVGGLILATGLLLMPLPGPGGLPVTLIGLAILSSEVPWARRLLQRLKQRVQRARFSRVAATDRWKYLVAVVVLLVLWLVGGLVVWRVWAF